MKRPWLKFLIFLIPAVAGTIFLIWRLSPTQAVIRRAEVILTSLEKKPLGAGSSTDKATRFRAVLHPDFSVKAPLPVPSGKVPPDTAASLVEELQDSIASCRISRDDERVTFPSDGRAIFEATLQVDVTVASGTRRLVRYRCQFEFERDGRDWLLLRVILTAI